MSIIGKKYKQGLNEYIVCHIDKLYYLINMETGGCYVDGLDFSSFMKLLEEDYFMEL